MEGLTNMDNIAISSKIVLMRNFEDYQFLDNLSQEEAKSVIQDVYNIITKKFNNDEFRLIKLWEYNSEYLKKYSNKSVINKENLNLKENKAIIVNENENISFIVNEEDHLKIQCRYKGNRLNDLYKCSDNIDNIIESEKEYSYNDTLGYLTVNPQNIGTAMKVSVMLHLPALVINKEIDKTIKFFAERDMILEEDKSEEITYRRVYRLTNKITLGLSEQEIINSVNNAVELICERENEARKNLMSKYEYEIKDQVYRAYGTLRYSVLITLNEALSLLSTIKLGAELELLDISSEQVDDIISALKKQSLISERELTTKQENLRRALLIKEMLT